MNKTVQLEDLCDRGEFQLRCAGAGQAEPFTGAPAVYLEWRRGEKNDAGWAAWSADRSEDDLELHTPWGVVTASPRRLRLYLEPVYARAFRPAEAAQAPEFLRAEIAAAEAPLHVEAFALLPDRDYFARTAIESYHLPPDPEDHRPRVRHNTVLMVSDQPFVNGQPPGRLTPAYAGWAY